MKITHILYLSEAEGQNSLSGAENHLWVLLPALANEGHEVELIALLWRGRIFTQVKQSLNELANKGVKVTIIERDSHRGFFRENISKILAWSKLWNCLHKRRNNIIHLHLEFMYAPYLAWLGGCRQIVYTLHNDEPHFNQLIWRIRLRVLNHIVSHYIAITNQVRNHYHKVSGVKLDQITTVYYGIDPLNTPPYSRKDFNIAEDAFVVGFVGRLTEQKNLRVLLEALKQHSSIVGVIVGNGPQKDELVQFSKVNEFRNVHFLGVITSADRVMPIFNIFCLPSLWEGLGLVLIEAMLRKVPIMGSRRGAIPEILNDGQHGILFEPTVDGLCQAIDYAFKNRTSIQAQVNDVYAYASKKFTIKSMVQGTLDVYKIVITHSKNHN